MTKHFSSYRAELAWWLIKRSKIGRWFFRYLLTQICFDLQIVDITLSVHERYRKLLGEVAE